MQGVPHRWLDEAAPILLAPNPEGAAEAHAAQAALPPALAPKNPNNPGPQPRDAPAKRRRGRPPGTGKLQKLAAEVRGHQGVGGLRVRVCLNP